MNIKYTTLIASMALVFSNNYCINAMDSESDDEYNSYQVASDNNSEEYNDYSYNYIHKKEPNLQYYNKICNKICAKKQYYQTG